VTFYIVIPLLLLVTIVQTALVPNLSIWGIFADLPLLFVVSWGLLQGKRQGLLWGCVAGMSVDILSGAPFGAATLSLAVVGFLAGLGQATVFRYHAALSLLAVFLATILYNLVFLAIVDILGQPVAWLDSLLRVVQPSAVLNALLLPLVFIPLRLVHRRFLKQEMEV
jgi:rod shape-determining protein MreD